MRIVVALIVALGLAGPAWAEPKGKGHGGGSHHEGTVASQPPGLARKDTKPHGLEKKDKTPPGWSKGEKRGWHDWFKRKKHEGAKEN